MDLAEQFRACVPRYLRRDWKRTDGCPASRIEAAERRLQQRLPASLRALHLSIGAVPELLTAHNRVLALDELVVEDEHLIFMAESQSVVSWGFSLATLGDPSPTVWQRNNTPPVEWFSEEQDLPALLISMWSWYVEIGALAP